MTDTPRALLTEGEKDALRGDESMSQGTRRAHLSRVEDKIQKMHDDARLLRDHAPDLGDDLYEAVCRQTIEERLARLEARMEQVERNINVNRRTNSKTADETDTTGG